jgi:DNA repair protein RadC
MTITHWPNADRPREKLLRQQERALTDAELIAIFLNTGCRGKTALDLARELLQTHGGLKKLATVPIATLLKTPGMGTAKYAALRAAIEIGRRCLQESKQIGDKLDNSAATSAYLTALLQHHSQEVFACLFLDAHFRLLAHEELFYGTIDSATVYPREIIRRALALNASKLILAHNHPSGIAKPSAADQDITNIIIEAAGFMGITVVDHVIIGNPDIFSFLEAGLI